MAEKTIKVKVETSFFLTPGKPVEPGTVVELPYAFALEMISCNRVSRVDVTSAAAQTDPAATDPPVAPAAKQAPKKT